ncbi:hypothetical protein SLOPH_1768 [Spraguea lophii 42_110]|uniref:Uncharacterized protein n=1 Tax=Spraguea lophii (strain 42_110) TaxID=1358809 RepID=S7WDW4_SPRLO|nr:hypothetical protein SLOPH_1768 [Spraguea lophii 42_110]
MFLLLSLIFCDELFHIKLANTNKYMTADSNPKTTTDIKAAGKFKMVNSKVVGTFFVVEIKTKKIFDISRNVSKLILYGNRHGRINQRFIITQGPRRVSVIKTANGMCLKYIESRNNFERRRCASTADQFFEIIYLKDIENKKKIKELKTKVRELEAEILKTQQPAESKTCTAELNEIKLLQEENKELKSEAKKALEDKRPTRNLLSDMISPTEKTNLEDQYNRRKHRHLKHMHYHGN